MDEGEKRRKKQKERMWKELNYDFRRMYQSRIYEKLHRQITVGLEDWWSFIGRRNRTLDDFTLKEIKALHNRVFDLVQTDFNVAIKYGIKVKDLHTLHIDSIRERKEIYRIVENNAINY